MTHSSTRRTWYLAATLMIVVGVATLGRTETPAVWTIGEPIVTYWAGPGYQDNVPLTDAAAKQMVDLGINLVWAASPAELEIARQNGLRAMYVDRSLIAPAFVDDPALRPRLDALVDSVRGNSALYAYHVTDEPSAAEFDRLGRVADYLRRRDPAHLAYIDLFPNYAADAAYGTKGYNAYLDTFISTVKPSLLSYDHYQFRTDYDSSGYLRNLAEMREKANAAGIPFMNIVQAASWDRGGVRIPTPDQERFLAYTTLAYGAEGISYYVWCWPGHQGGIVAPDGKPTAIYDTLKAVNREFVAIARQCQPLRSLGAYLKGYREGGLPPETSALPKNSPFDVGAVANDAAYQDGKPLIGVLVGLFGAKNASAADATLAQVVNLDYAAGKKYTVTGPEELSVFNATTGQWTATGQREAVLDLPPGGGVLVGLTSAASQIDALRQRREAAHRPRRIIMNNDGNEVHGKPQLPHTRESFLEQRTSPLVGTQVDSIFYCSGVFNFYSHHSDESELLTHRDRKAADWAWELGNTGPDSLATVVEFGHKNNIEVFWSMRMNDTHDSGDPTLLCQWKQEHPEYLMGKLEDKKSFKAGGRRWSAVNYEVPEVREKAFRILRDVATRYDVDGLELDFFRHPIYFKPQMFGQPVTQEQRDLMTELIRRVRKMADETAAKRGRPMLIAVRVPDSVECASAIGLDIVRWMKEDLIDLMVVSDYLRLNPWETSVQLGHQYGVPVYPSLSDARSKCNEAEQLRKSPECYRGRALEAWQAGADGIYLFNYFNPRGEVFRELGDPKELADMAQTYPAGVMSAGVNAWVANGRQWLRLPVPLPENPLKLAAGGTGAIDVRVPVSADVLARATSCGTRVLVADDPATAAKSLTVKLNGHPLAGGVPAGKWIAYSAEASWLKSGMNRLELTLSADSAATTVQDATLDVGHVPDKNENGKQQ